MRPPTLPTWLLALLVLLLATAQAQPSAAQDAGTADAAVAADPNALTPPKLLRFVDAGFPDAARSLGIREASVVLLVTIGTDGQVEEAEVSEPAGYGFDELALAAVRDFVFEPAKRGETPLRSRIQYRYDFRLPEEAEPDAGEPEAAPANAPGKLEITVTDVEDDKPLHNAEVLISSNSDPNVALRLLSSEQGKASSSELAPGTYVVRVTRKGYEDQVHEEQVASGQVTELAYRLSQRREYEEYGAVARVKAPPREVTRRTIEREVLTRVPGTRGDALRAIQLLPGVGRPPFGAGLVLIRGSSPQDSTVLLNGIPVPLLYHFGGLTSFINSRALERIDFYPGNFSVKYGRRMGGVIDVGTRDPRGDGYHGVLDVNLPLDSSLLVEGPITKKATFLVAGRRSYLGELARAVIPSGTFDAFAAPVYNDYQLFIVYKPTPRDNVRFSVYGSSDRLDVLFSDEGDENPTIRGIELGQRFDRQQVGWTHRYNNQVNHWVELSFGRNDNSFRLGPDLYFKLLSNALYLRSELRYRVNKVLGLTLGTDSLVNFAKVRYAGPELTGDEGQTQGGSLESRTPTRFSQNTTAYEPSLYIEGSIRPTQKLLFVPGFRVDYNSLNDRFTYDPRMSMRYTLTERTSLKAGVGSFSQPPQPQETAPGLGNPNLKSQRAIHYGAGVDHAFSDDFTLGVEGFYKRIYNRVVPTESGFPPFTNDGKGRIYGIEVAGRKLATGRWFGFLSYTLMWSQRKDQNGDWRPFDYDQRHIFTLAGSVRLGRGWEVGATMRVVTGNPRTPYLPLAPINLDTGEYVPVSGRINSARNPTFNRLDLRVEKQWIFDSWRLAWYLDIQNTYNARNPEGITYSFDYTQRGSVRGLPILPIMGLRGEL